MEVRMTRFEESTSDIDLEILVEITKEWYDLNKDNEDINTFIDKFERHTM